MRPRARRQSASAERRLRSAEIQVSDLTSEVTRLRQALDVIEPGVVICDETGEVVLRNRRSRILDGVQPTGALVAAAIDEVLQTARSGGPSSHDLELRGPPRQSLVISGRPLVAGGKRVGTIAEIDDVSERRRLDAVRRDFVANVSHELRTPVGALGVLAEALAAESDPEIVARVCHRISLEAERAGHLIADLLDLSRIEAEPSGPMELVKIDEVISVAVDRVRALAAQMDVTLVESEEAGLEVEGDSAQLASAVGNLLENAVKYSERGCVVEVEGYRDDHWVSIEVRDSGIGIPQRDLERIFERFYRVDRARSRETGGTGLGLAIVRHVATNHGGTVAVDSREGEGSVFTLMLPPISNGANPR